MPSLVAIGQRDSTVSKGQRLSDILILVRFLWKFVRIKLILWSLYVRILVPIAQRDSTFFKSQRLSGFKKTKIAFSNFVKR